jgi:hypothetical protein
MFVKLTDEQVAVIEHPPVGRIFLEGPAGCGKTTTGVERLLHLMALGVPASQILLLLPQRTLGAPYYAALKHPGVTAGGVVSVMTVSGLAQRMVDLFWPLAAERAGFARPDRYPVFLTLETAQFYMAHLVRPLLDEGLFDAVILDRNRLYSQLLDDLNKSALVGFPHTQIGERLKSAWLGEPGQLRIYEDVQTCAGLFRQYCLEHNLLDFSLQVEVFLTYLWPDPLVRGYLQNTYRHLLVDNLEEDTPTMHDLLADWLPDLESALLIFDTDAGYRSYLGADPVGAYRLKAMADHRRVLDRSFVSRTGIQAMSAMLADCIRPDRPGALPGPLHITEQPVVEIREAMQVLSARFAPELMETVSRQIETLIVEDGIAPGEIVILAPYLSDALRFSMVQRLESLGIPVTSSRPSRSLREEPVTLCMLTMAMLAHPEWGYHPTRFDVAHALVQAIQGMDLVRARLLVDNAYLFSDGRLSLSSFDCIEGEFQERITFVLGEKYDRLVTWLAHHQDTGESLDHFLSRLFGEVLSQPGFGFHDELQAGQIAANLIESIQKFHWAAGDSLAEEGAPLGREYLRMVQDGVIAAQYFSRWQAPPSNAVFMAPAYTFLMSNRPVQVQFWLDAGSVGWSERLEQPLTHPYVLSRQWEAGRKWTDADELNAGTAILERLVTGLLRRCRERVFLCINDIGEQGYEQRGPLLQAIQRLRRTIFPMDLDHRL